ncbi:MAG: ArsR/SmtB family transcription factor [Anaerolineales bacterium]
MDKFKLSAKLFKALMHPARLAILDVLRESEHCVCHLESQLGYRQAYISQQLAILRDADLVSDRREGWNIYYNVSAPEVFKLIDQAAEITGEEVDIPSTNDLRKVSKKPCTCPKCTSTGNRSAVQAYLGEGENK